MPSESKDVVAHRLRLVLSLYGRTGPASDVCTRHATSHKSGYKWLKRFREGGEAALADRSRAPHSSPQAIDPGTAERLLELRVARPNWGPRKLLWELHERKPDLALPAPSTVGDLLRRHGLVKRRGRRRHTQASAPFGGCNGPNDVMCVDFKGHFHTGDGKRCNPFTATDAWSRFVFACQHLPHGDEASVRAVLERLMREYGLPAALRSDNGSPFASHGLCGLTGLSVWLLRLGVRLERIKPGHPEQNGRHERMHLTLKAETASPPQHSLRLQQQAFDRWRHEFNWERPHEALGQVPPGRLYRPSPRPFPAHLPDFEYPAGWTVRRVVDSGVVKWHSEKVRISEALIGEPVGFAPIADGFWLVRLGRMNIGVFDETSHRFSPELPAGLTTWSEVSPMSPVYVSPMSPV